MADDLDSSSAQNSHLDLEEKILNKAGGSRGGKNRSRGGRSGGGGGQGREVQVSKALSKLLRHQAENAGIALDSEGFAPLDRVISWPPIRSLNVTLSEIHSIVETNEKRRFSLKPNPATNPALDTSAHEPSSWLIRANQGHSIKLDSAGLLHPVTLEDEDLPAQVVHGTYFAFWPAIESSGGLRKMGRNHVHFATGVVGENPDVISGMRKDAELLVYVDLEASLRDGMKWWRSDNGVLLTEGLPLEDGEGLGGDGQGEGIEGNEGEPAVSTRYFKEVVGRKVDVGTLWRDGEKVGDLPKGIKARVPHGKERAAGSSRGGRGR